MTDENPDEIEMCGCKLNKCARYCLFVLLVLVGTVMSFCSIITGLSGATASVILVTVGNCLVLFSLFILNGPKQQWEKMMDPARSIVSILYLIAIVMCAISIIFFSKILTIIFLVLQECLMVLYILSYFPGLQNWMKDCCCKKTGGDATAPMV